MVDPPCQASPGAAMTNVSRLKDYFFCSVRCIGWMLYIMHCPLPSLHHCGALCFCARATSVLCCVGKTGSQSDAVRIQSKTKPQSTTGYSDRQLNWMTTLIAYFVNAVLAANTGVLLWTESCLRRRCPDNIFTTRGTKMTLSMKVLSEAFAAILLSLSRSWRCALCRGEMEVLYLPELFLPVSHIYSNMSTHCTHCFVWRTWK